MPEARQTAAPGAARRTPFAIRPEAAAAAPRQRLSGPSRHTRSFSTAFFSMRDTSRRGYCKR